MELQEEIKALSEVSVALLQKLEPEPSLIKKLLEEIFERFKSNSWSLREDSGWIKKFEREKYTLRIALVHARKGEHITGADLLFELEGKKIVFIQSKRASRNGRIYFNRFQLQKLMELEWQIYIRWFCSDLRIDFHEYIENIHYLLHKLRRRDCSFPPNIGSCLLLLPPPFHATFYLVMMVEHEEIVGRIFHTSEICFSLGGRKSVHQNEFLHHGLKLDEFQEMFWGCVVGGPDMEKKEKENILYFYSLFTNRLIVWLSVEEK